MGTWLRMRERAEVERMLLQLCGCSVWHDPAEKRPGKEAQNRRGLTGTSTWNADAAIILPLIICGPAYLHLCLVGISIELQWARGRTVCPSGLVAVSFQGSFCCCCRYWGRAAAAAAKAASASTAKAACASASATAMSPPASAAAAAACRLLLASRHQRRRRLHPPAIATHSPVYSCCKW